VLPKSKKTRQDSTHYSSILILERKINRFLYFYEVRKEEGINVKQG